MENLSLSKFKLEHTECDFKREVEHKKLKAGSKAFVLLQTELVAL